VRVLPDVWKLDSKRALPVVVAALAEGAERFGMRIVFYRIAADRLMMLVEADDRDALTRGMQGFGIRFSKAINRMMGTEGTIFAERYHLEVLVQSEQTRRALARLLERPPPKTSPPALGKLADPRSRSLRNALSSAAVARLARRVPSVEPKLPKRRPAS
jgi:hypothetical protein